jgi:hypothetical protein
VQALAFFVELAATTPVTPGLTNLLSYYRTLDATTTATPEISQLRDFFEPVAATTTVTPALGLQFTKKITMDATTTVTPDLQYNAGATEITMDATTTVTAAMTDQLIFYRGIEATSTVTPEISRQGSFFRLLSAVTTILVSPLNPGDGQYAYRLAAADLHGDALWKFVQQNESEYTADELVGALNELNATYGIEYEEARETYLAAAEA